MALYGEARVVGSRREKAEPMRSAAGYAARRSSSSEVGLNGSWREVIAAVLSTLVLVLGALPFAESEEVEGVDGVDLSLILFDRRGVDADMFTCSSLVLPHELGGDESLQETMAVMKLNRQ